MSSRTWKQALGAIWGSTATAAAGVPSSPVAGTAYRDSTADSNPTADPGYLSGFQFLSKSPSQIANQALFLVSSALDDLQTHGTLGWESGTAYPVGAICHGSDNQPYVCAVTCTAQDPTSTSGYWVLMPPAARSSFATSDSIVLSGLTVKWGIGPVYSAAEGYQTIPFPGSAFPVACLLVVPSALVLSPTSTTNGYPQYVSSTLNNFTIFWQDKGGGRNIQCSYVAIGY